MTQNRRILIETEETAEQWEELLDGMRRRIAAIDRKIKAASESRDTTTSTDASQS